MRRTTIQRILSILLVMLFFSVFSPKAFADEPESLWKDCTYKSSNPTKEGLRSLWDDNPMNNFVVRGPGQLTISWPDEVPASSLYLEWTMFPRDFTVTQFRADGSIIESIPGETFQLNQLYPVSSEAAGVTLSSQTDMDLSKAVLYGPDMIPNNYHPWNPTPKKLDFLVVATHPDDDVIFMGAIVPLYGVEKGLNGTILYVCSSNIRDRGNEAMNGAWVMGLRNHPLFGGFPNIVGSQSEKREYEFTTKKLALYFVRILRQYQPEVLVTHDKKGEYGHWQHKNVSAAICRAVTLAADPSFDPDSFAQYGAFQVKKLYLHLFAENQIKLDVLAPLDKFDSKNVFEIAKEAFAEHVSQVQVGHYSVLNEGKYSLSDFGLYYSAVGPDLLKNDMFENIAPESLSNYVAFVPTVTPDMRPTPSPRPVAQTPVPTDSPAPTDPERHASSFWVVYALAAVVVSAFIAGAVLFTRARRKRDNP